MKICKSCGSCDCVKGRRYCESCLKKYMRDKAHKYYFKQGKQRREQNHKSICRFCGNAFCNWGRDVNDICPSCRKMIATQKGSGDYVKIEKTSKNLHRELAKQILNRSLSPNEVIHHVNEIKNDNRVENLMVMSRYSHVKLHNYLRMQRVIYEKSLDKDSVNCWDNLRVSQTTAWLEMTGAKVIKLWELVNQQPSTVKGEGSETKHGEPKSDVSDKAKI